MNIFLSDVCDKLFPMEDISVFLNDDQNLSYVKVFASVIDTTMFNWVYKKLFSHYPSKILAASFKGNNFDEMIVAIDIQIDKVMRIQLLKQFEDFKEKITRDTALLKKEVWQKMFERGVASSDKYDESKTLYSQYNKDFDFAAENKYIIENRLYSCNQITKRSSSLHSKTMIPEGSLLTRRDVIIHGLFLDKSLLHKLNRVIYVRDDPDGIVGAISNIDQVVIISEHEFNNAHFVCSHNIMQYVPCITYGYEPSCNFYVPPIVRSMYSLFPDNIDNIAKVYFGNTFPKKFLEKIFEYWVKNHDTPIKKRRKKTENCIVLVDSRKTFMSLLSILITQINVDWDVIIFTSWENQQYYKKYIPTAKFYEHDKLNLTRKFDINDYNEIMKSKTFWKQLDYKHALVIQEDGMIMKKGIERFLKYDYVGAPWFDHYAHKEAGVIDNVGNGGLSLRNIEKMIDVIESNPDSVNQLFFKNNIVIPEDIFFAKFISNKPDTDTASEFAFEMIFNKKALGFHKPYAYLGEDIIMQYFSDE